MHRAGVSGLTTALELAKKGHIVTIVAKHMPGDYDVEYTSPWAGANVMPMATEADSRWERRTWPVLKKLAEEVPAAGIHFQRCQVQRRKKDAAPDSSAVLSDSLFLPKPWYSTLFEDYRELSAHELPADIVAGCEFTSVCINTAVYLPWLVGQCVSHGAVVKRAVLKHISEASGMSHHPGCPKADVVVNASGLLACRLGGVMDSAMYPIRGQIVVVRDEAPLMLTTSSTDDGEDELLYTMTRAVGGGTILGGTYQKGNWDGNPDPNVAVRIMKRAVEAQPELTGGKGIEGLSVIRHGVGLRPGRVGGLRLEREVIDEVEVVHNYGHAGWGYQGSFGCAEGVVELVDRIVAEKGVDGLKI
ncbi:D-amino-acid oxidase-like protein [Coniochaeta sp. 2T2.1]|nr:D-amino-acid oxidase-like protein [Coniochaeta sp. 2T2.1]